MAREWNCTRRCTSSVQQRGQLSRLQKVMVKAGSALLHCGALRNRFVSLISSTMPPQPFKSFSLIKRTLRAGAKGRHAEAERLNSEGEFKDLSSEVMNGRTR